MKDYKDTLNLPKTGFPMKANLTQREPVMLKRWLDEDIYGGLRKLRKGKDKFIFHDGPPYANGDIHIGHAVNKILKDLVVKSKTLDGFDVPYIPGWDCHGLPIALNVEKKFGKAGRKISVEEFRQQCRIYAQKQVDKQRESFKRLGVTGDWDHPYLTMDYQYEADIIRCFAKILANKHLQKGFKPVYWCVDCGSALAEAEVEYMDKHSPAIDVRFKVIDEADFLSRCHTAHEQGEGPLSVPIWTTTPWTLPANQAVALNPSLEYAVVQCTTEQGKERLLVAEALLKDVMIRYDINDYRVIAYCRGDALEGAKLQHPFYERQVPIVLGDHVTTETGTGAVHTAPGHGQEDYIVAQYYDLPIDNPVGANGCFLPDTPIFAGENVYKANDHVVEVLKDKEVLLHLGALKHSYPHCWRHKTPLIFRATPQWFISMEQEHLREMALAEIVKTKFIPDWGQARITDMVTKRPDWCVSRQRIWGVPIAVFAHKDTGELHPDTVALLEQVAQRVEVDGVEAWDKLQPKELLGDDAADYVKVKDILDVWFDSGVSHTCVMAKRGEFPIDLYMEGSDQHRGWFQSSLLTSCAIHGRAPYKEVMTHGFVVDATGRKMSKSLGNVIDPLKVMKTMGADILRLWVASTDYTREIHVSDEILKRASDAYRRIRNTARYLVSNLNDFDPAVDLLASSEMLALDRWAVDRAKVAQEMIQKAYDTYQFHAVYKELLQFCSIDMGSFYLDIIKDRQYTTKADSVARRSSQTAMYHILQALVRWIAPVLSFTADEIWQFMTGEKEDSVFFATWYEKLDDLPHNDVMNANYWQRVMEVRDEVNKEIERLRNADVLGSALEAEVVIYADDEHYSLLGALEDELRFVLITSSATVKHLADAPDDAVATEFAGLKLKITASEYKKCIRCWHRRADVGSNPDHPEICSRCVTNVDGDGEVRRYA
jgi:isoleucyl-tRNA synthetase